LCIALQHQTAIIPAMGRMRVIAVDVLHDWPSLDARDWADRLDEDMAAFVRGCIDAVELHRRRLDTWRAIESVGARDEVEALLQERTEE
jgi:predicted aldo/keto reductase-like oxidoreductase